MVNRGPSLASDAQFDILVPTNDNEGDYYIYLYEATVSPMLGECTGPFNPDGLSSPVESRRKRR